MIHLSSLSSRRRLPTLAPTSTLCRIAAASALIAGEAAVSLSLGVSAHAATAQDGSALGGASGRITASAPLLQPAPEADLEAVKLIPPREMVTPGGTFIYQVRVTNNGPDEAQNVVVHDMLPAPLSYVNSTSNCTGNGQEVTCTADQLPANATHVFTFRVVLDPNYVGDGSDLCNNATVSSTTSDPNPGNNTTPDIYPTLA